MSKGRVGKERGGRILSVNHQQSKPSGGQGMKVNKRPTKLELIETILKYKAELSEEMLNEGSEDSLKELEEALEDALLLFEIEASGKVAELLKS